MDPKLESKLEQLSEEMRDVESRLATAGLDASEYADLGRRHSELKSILELAGAWRSAIDDAAEAAELAEADDEMAEELAEMAVDR